MAQWRLVVGVLPADAGIGGGSGGEDARREERGEKRAERRFAHARRAGDDEVWQWL